MNRIVTLMMTLALLVACTADDGADHSARKWRRVARDEAPWTIKVPPSWTFATVALKPRPMGMVGAIVTTAVATTSFRPGPTAAAPHSRSAASQELGDDGAVVLVQAMSPPNESEVWQPPSGADLTRRPPSRWHLDSQNPGWMARERKLCADSACVSVLEWYGPDASDNDTERLARIAASVDLPID